MPPGIEGIGELGSTSTLVVAPTSLENLALHAAGPTMVVVGEWTVPVETFHVRLGVGGIVLLQAQAEAPHGQAIPRAGSESGAKIVDGLEFDQ